MSRAADYSLCGGHARRWQRRGTRGSCTSAGRARRTRLSRRNRRAWTADCCARKRRRRRRRGSSIGACRADTFPLLLGEGDHVATDFAAFVGRGVAADDGRHGGVHCFSYLDSFNLLTFYAGVSQKKRSAAASRQRAQTMTASIPLFFAEAFWLYSSYEQRKLKRNAHSDPRRRAPAAVRRFPPVERRRLSAEPRPGAWLKLAACSLTYR
jgi:hypothetical protein